MVFHSTDSMQACNDPLKDTLYITGKFIYKASIVYKPGQVECLEQTQHKQPVAACSRKGGSSTGSQGGRTERRATLAAHLNVWNVWIVGSGDAFLTTSRRPNAQAVTYWDRVWLWSQKYVTAKKKLKSYKVEMTVDSSFHCVYSWFQTVKCPHSSIKCDWMNVKHYSLLE